MGKHVAALGFIHLVTGGAAVIIGVLLVFFGIGSGFVGWISGEELGMGLGLAGMMGGAIGLISIFGGFLGLLTSYGLLARTGWGRILGIISSVLWVLNFSWISLLGIYGLWVLLSEAGTREFRKRR